ncbi:MAG TPA: hypothetical protein VNV16_12560 [Methylibium sp.]|nr:hypothetical protein [Methylibium sp.]
MSAARIPLRPSIAAGLARAAARLCARPRVSLIAAVRRALRCAYLRWRIEQAERDALHMAEQIERDQRQLVAYRYAVQELRCDLAASQSD